MARDFTPLVPLVLGGGGRTGTYVWCRCTGLPTFRSRRFSISTPSENAIAK